MSNTQKPKKKFTLPKLKRKPKKEKRTLTAYQRKKRTRTILNSIVILILIGGIVGLTVGSTLAYTMIKSSTVVLDLEKLKDKGSTIIYDSKGNQIALIGKENRINIKYEDLPQVVIDAFVSIEDSRFFEHNGFDIPRFTKALIQNLQSLSFAQGGSTFTMQMIKNTYYVTEESLAAKSIDRKVQEIYYALKVETMISKKQIFELYINKINFGGPARGIEAASRYYFNKSCTDLTLSEAATLAGVINQPNTFNPYYNIDYATDRRWETLDLMKSHGYITEEEFQIAIKIKIEDLLVGEEEDLSSILSAPLQSYIDEVIDEVERVYGIDPYDQALRIYTAMDPYTQEVADKIIRGESFKFPDGNMQVGFTVLNNKNGEIVAIGGGRGRKGERTFSFATGARKQPGSSIKVILDYALGFEYAGISTSHTELDDRTNWQGSSLRITNASGRYIGDVRIQQALTASLNIPAVKVHRKAVNAMGKDKMIAYMKAIGFDDIVAENYDEQYSIGGSSLNVSSLQMAAAQAMLFNNGVYNEPHCITRIEFIDGSQETIVANFKGVQVISPAGAWLIAHMMEKNVSNDIYLGNLRIIKKNYPVYAKTGSSDWGNSGLKYGIPAVAMKDNWMNASTSEFTCSVWTGYDKAIKGKTTWFTSAKYQFNIVGKTNTRILDALKKSFGTPGAIKQPKGVSGIKHVLGTWPYMAVPEWCPPKYATSGYVKAGTAKIDPWPTPTIDNLTSFSASVTGNSGTSAFINVTWPQLSSEMPVKVESTTYKLSSGKTGTRLFSKTWVDGIVQYCFDVYDDATGKRVGSYSTSTFSDTIRIDLSSLSEGNHNLSIIGYYAYTIAPVKSGTITVSVSVNVNHMITPPSP